MRTAAVAGSYLYSQLDHWGRDLMLVEKFFDAAKLGIQFGRPARHLQVWFLRIPRPRERRQRE